MQASDRCSMDMKDVSDPHQILDTDRQDDEDIKVFNIKFHNGYRESAGKLTYFKESLRCSQTDFWEVLLFKFSSYNAKILSW